MPTDTFISTSGPDLIALLISIAIVGAYYIFLRRKVRENPTYTIHGVNEVARTAWVLHVMSNPSKDIMAVQTLRNFIMGSSLMASTATVLIIGTLTLSGQSDNIQKSWHALNAFGSHSAQLWILKVLCLLVDFIFAFFAFTMSVRLANHVLFMLNIPPQETHPELSPQNVAKRLTRSGNFFAIGIRAFFFAVPLVFWLFGPVFLILATLGLVYALLRLDKSNASAAGAAP